MAGKKILSAYLLKGLAVVLEGKLALGACNSRYQWHSAILFFSLYYSTFYIIMSCIVACYMVHL